MGSRQTGRSMKWIHGKVRVASRQGYYVWMVEESCLWLITGCILTAFWWLPVFFLYTCCLIEEGHSWFLLLDWYGASYLSNFCIKILEKHLILLLWNYNKNTLKKKKKKPNRFQIYAALKALFAVWVDRCYTAFRCVLQLIEWALSANDSRLRLMSRDIPAFHCDRCHQVLCLCVCYDVSQCGGELHSALIDLCYVAMVCTQSAVLLWWGSPCWPVNTNPEWCLYIF